MARDKAFVGAILGLHKAVNLHVRLNSVAPCSLHGCARSSGLWRSLRLVDRKTADLLTLLYPIVTIFCNSFSCNVHLRMSTRNVLTW